MLERMSFWADMKTLLRKISSGLYFQGPDRWTGDPAEAFNFKSIDRALSFIRTWHLQEVELAFAFRDQPEIKRVPPERIEVKYFEE
jgi:hypothetical protein